MKLRKNKTYDYCLEILRKYVNAKIKLTSQQLDEIISSKREYELIQMNKKEVLKMK